MTRTTAKSHSQTKRTVRANAAVVLPPNTVTNILVNYHGSLPDDRDFLFEPELPASYDLGHAGGVFAHIVDANLTLVQAKNATEAPVVLPKNIRLGTVVEYSVDGCYQVSCKSSGLAACG